MSGLPPRHSIAILAQKDEIAFQRAEHRKSLLSLSQGFSSAPRANMRLLGTFRHRLLSSLPLSPCGPFMVELFTPPDLLEYPSLVIGPAPAVASRGLPTAAHVKRTSLVSLQPTSDAPSFRWEQRNRSITPIERGPNPVGGFAVQRPLTCFEHDGFGEGQEPVHRSLSASPPLRGH